MNKDNELEELLIKWFETATFDKRHFWTRNRIANIIRLELKAIDKWKNRSRGNSEAGYKKAVENRKSKEEREKIKLENKRMDEFMNG